MEAVYISAIFPLGNLCQRYEGDRETVEAYSSRRYMWHLLARFAPYGSFVVQKSAVVNQLSQPSLVAKQLVTESRSCGVRIVG